MSSVGPLAYRASVDIADALYALLEKEGLLPKLGCKKALLKCDIREILYDRLEMLAQDANVPCGRFHLEPSKDDSNPDFFPAWKLIEAEEE